ncbi:MAG: hypothetical protein GHCLOJNM_01764 [bacterium]|nr:hypothetical protein [bacterium]
MADKPRLYLETSVVGYLEARSSRDILVLAHQEITRRWWKEALPGYEVFISEVVLAEASRGDQDAARKRLASLRGFSELHVSAEVERLASVYLEEI